MKNKRTLLGIGLLGLVSASFGLILIKSDVTIAGYEDDKCEWKCNADFYQSGNKCEPCPDGYSSPAGSIGSSACKKAQCGSATVGMRVDTPTEGLCDFGTASEVNPETNSYSWTCTYLTSSASCNAIRVYNCGGTQPSGNGVKTGMWYRTYSYTPQNWTYNASKTGACEWNCKNGYERSGNTCVAKQAQCGTPAGGLVAPTEGLCDLGTPSAVTSGNDTFDWTCTNLTETVHCSTSRIYPCGGTTPSGNGVLTGWKYREYGYTPQNWTYTTSETLGKCEWKCDEGYERSGNTCVAKQAQCGTPAGGVDAPMTGLCDLGSSSVVTSGDDTFDWTCTNLTETVHCSASRIYPCGGTTPSGNGVLTGWKYREYGYTPQNWTYKASGTLGKCEWNCDDGYISGANNKCTVIQPQCGPATQAKYKNAPTNGLCNEPGTSSNMQTGDSNFTWECTNLTKSVTCSATRIYECGGTTPSGNGVLIGSGYREYGYTPMSWTFNADGELSACEWKCRGGYEQGTNTCIAAGYGDLEMYFITDAGAQGYYAMMDRNLGATAYMGEQGKSETDWYGSYYQWGNNYGFENQGPVNTSTTQVSNANLYGPDNYYSSDTFIIGNADWANPGNNNLWGNNGSESARRGPCPVDYHLPTKNEFIDIVDNYWKKSVDNTASSQRSLDTLMPFAGARSNSDAGVVDQGSVGLYWSSMYNSSTTAYGLTMTSTSVDSDVGDGNRSRAHSVRCFRNSPTPSLTIHPNGGMGALITVHDGIITKLGTPTKGTEVFDGWHTNSSLTSAKVQVGNAIPGSKNLYAKWIKAECGTASGQTGSNLTSSSSDLCGTGTVGNFTPSTNVYTWNCTTGTSTVSCSAPRNYECTGTPPSGNGLQTGPSFSNTPKSWTYKASGTLGECEWRCDTGYKSGANNVCSSLQAQCGAASGQTYLTLTEDAVELCAAGNDVGDFSTSVNRFTWKCGIGNTVISCSAVRNYGCTGTPPSGNGVITGANSYEYGYTPNSWTYKAEGELEACEWRCDAGYQSGTNTCTVIQPQCGSATQVKYKKAPTNSLCDIGTSSNMQTGNSLFTWECTNLTESVTCTGTRIYECTGTPPSGDGVLTGDDDREYGHTPTSWTYSADGELEACEWKCRGGYVQGTNTCESAGYGDLEMFFVSTTGVTGYSVMMDRNLGATEVYNGTDNINTYGYYYQWGNNYGFENQGPVNTSTTRVSNANLYGPDNYYSSDTFILGNGAWAYPGNNNLWGGNGSESARQGPCPDGYHVPLKDEFVYILENWFSNGYSNQIRSTYCLMPFAGNRNYTDASVEHQGIDVMYWTTSPDAEYFNMSRVLSPNWSSTYYLSFLHTVNHDYGLSVRCFKNSPTPSLTIHPNGGTGALITVHDGKIKKLLSPHKGTDVFGGWYKYPTYAASTQVHVGDTISNGASLYAKWIKAECGAASGQAYQNLTSSSSDLCGTGTVGNFSTTTTGFTWNCTTGTSTVSCSAAKEQNCTGTPPQGDHVLMGASTYVSPHTPTSWTYTTNSSLTGCQWSCETGYVDDGNKCVTPQEKQCGPYNPLNFKDLDMYFLPNTNEGEIAHYTLMDRNLGATEVYNGTNNVCTYGYYYQRGNNYGFSNQGEIKTSTTLVNDASFYGPGNYYSSDTFIKVSSSPYDWANPSNNNLWGGDGSVYERKGPCPDDYHVPLKDEFVDIVNNWKEVAEYTSSTVSSQRMSDSLMPFAGYRLYNHAGVSGIGEGAQAGEYWSTTRLPANSIHHRAWTLAFFSSNALNPEGFRDTAYGGSVRCFKNTPNSILTVHPFGGTGALIIVYDGKIKKLGTPTRTGADFLGWYSDSGFANRVYENNNVPASANLYAKWNITQCSPGYYIAGNTCVQCQPGYYCPDGQNRSGCVVGDYNSEWGAISCNDCPTGYTTTGTTSTSVTQCFKKLNVQYNKNGAESIGATTGSCEAHCTTATSCSTSCSVEAPSITRAGFDAIGWNANQNAYVGVWVITLAGAHNSTTQYYAITKKDVDGTFIAGEGVYSLDTTGDSCMILNTATSCNIPMAEATCTGGYYGPRWDEQDLNGVSNDVTVTAYCDPCPAGKTSPIGAMTVNDCEPCPSGKYKSGDICVNCPTGTTSDGGAANVGGCYKTLTATFNANGSTSVGSGSKSCNAHCPNTSCSSFSCNVGSNSINRNGFEILGWSTDPNEHSATYTTSQQITITQNTSFYAITKKDVHGTFTAGQGVFSVNPTSDTCTIWNTETSCDLASVATCTGGYYGPRWDPSNSFTGVLNDVTATASCSPCPAGKTSPVGAITADQCVTTECPLGQYKQGNNCVSCPNGTTTSGSATSVTSCYKTFTATYNKNGATSIGTTSKSCDAHCANTSCNSLNCNVGPNNIVRNGWTILGWNTSSNAHSRIYTTGQQINLTQNITLYAITSQTCTAGKYTQGGSTCYNCGAGTYKTLSTTKYNLETNPGDCIPCGNKPDDNAHYTTSPWTNSNCPWECNEGFVKYKDETDGKEKCGCPAGEYYDTSSKSCVKCPYFEKGYTSVIGAVRKEQCFVKCNCGEVVNQKNGGCEPCLDWKNKPRGMYVTGHVVYLGKTSAKLGYACNNCSNLPSNAYWSGNACLDACDYGCNTDYYRDIDKNVCQPCTTGYGYHTPAGSIGGVKTCKVTCNPGYHVATHHSACEACPIGEASIQHVVYAWETSTVMGTSSCAPCTNGPDNKGDYPLGVGYHYTSYGTTVNPTNCSWQCNTGYYQNGNRCLPCGAGYTSYPGADHCEELPKCGSANGGYFATQPTNNLCNPGSASNMVEGYGMWNGYGRVCPANAGPKCMSEVIGWSWNCSREINGETYTVSCMANKAASCANPCADGARNPAPIPHGSSKTCYKSTSVNCPNSCDSQTKTCNNGERDKGGFGVLYTKGTCSVKAVNTDYLLTSCPDYSSYCTSAHRYDVSNKSCIDMGIRYKITGCKNGYYYHEVYGLCFDNYFDPDDPGSSNWSQGVCFLPGTPVLTPDGSKNIEDIEVGDLVLSYSANHEFEYNKVLNKFVHENSIDDVYTFVVNGDVIEATALHPFYVVGSANLPYQCSLPYRWKSAKNIQVGEQLMMSDGSLVTIDKISHRSNLSTTYNLNIENAHTYFVGKGYLVHNDLYNPGGGGKSDWGANEEVLCSCGSYPNGLYTLYACCPYGAVDLNGNCMFTRQCTIYDCHHC